MSLSPFVCVHWTFELHTSFQSIFTTLRAKWVRRGPFGLCQLAGVLRRPNGMRYTVWCPKRCCSPFSSPQHQSTCGRHAVCIGDHDVYHRSDRSEFKWDAIESAPTSKCLRVTQETFKQNSWGHSLHPGKIDAQVQCIRLGFPSPSREVGLADLRTRSATQLPTPRSSILRRRYTVYSRLHRVLRQHILSLKACAINNFFGI